MMEQWKPVNHCFHESCDKFPEYPAQIFNKALYPGETKDTYTYEEMLVRVEDIACGLISMGFEPGNAAGIMSRSTPYWTQVDMAILDSRGVVVTIYSTLSAGEVSYILSDSGCRYCFVEGTKELDRVMSVKADLPALEKVIVMDLTFKGSGMAMGLGELIEKGRSWKERNLHLYHERWKSVGIDDLCTILYTSGTTGKGKGVILTHWCASSRLVETMRFLSRYGMEITETDVTICFLPLSHIFERGSCQMLALIKGSCIAYADSPGTLLLDMQKYNPTWMNCVPRLYEKIFVTFQEKMSQSPIRKALFDLAFRIGRRALEYRKDERGCYDMSPGFNLSSRLPWLLRIEYRLADMLFAKVRALFGTHFRFAFSASAGIAPDLLLFYYTLGLAVLEGYGSTESASACILNPLTACKPGSIGIETDGALTRVAEDGELEISGVGVFKGYLNMPWETAESFTPDGWFRTGDIVSKDDQGYYRVVDRKKAIICTSVGKNIAPAKIEAQFSLSRVIEQVFVIGDERNFITALFVPNFGYLIELFDKENIPYDKSGLVFSDAQGIRLCIGVGQDFVDQPRLRELIEKEVRIANEHLEGFEQIKNYSILSNRFTEENGCLTPTQKTRKKTILTNYGAVISRMYAQAR